MDTPLGTLAIYARDIKKSADFYVRHFCFITTGEVSEGLIELRAPHTGAGTLIHQAAKSVKLGKVGVKLVFHVKDVAALWPKRGHGVSSSGRSMRPMAIHSPTPRTRTRIL